MAKDPFQKIAEDAIREAERVPCDRAEFERGMATLWQAINDRCEADNINPRDPDMFEG